MTSEPEPSTTNDPEASADDATLQPAVGASARLALPALDPRAQFAVGTGIAVAVLGLLGSIVGAWSLSFSGVILVAVGLTAAGAGYESSGRDASPSWVVPLRDLILGSGTIAAVLGSLFLIEIVTDLDNVHKYGDVVGLLATIGLAVAGVALYIAAIGWWTGGPAEPWTTALASSGRPTRLVFVGAGLVTLGWLGNVMFGFWYLEAGSEVITFSLLAALVMRATADPEEPLRLPLPPAFLALASAIIGAIIAIQHTSALLDQRAPIEDWLAQVIYVVGVAFVVVGAAMASSEGTRTLTEGSTEATPQP